MFTQLCRRHGPAAVFVGATDSGREFAPRFAARLNTGCTSDATELAYNAASGDIEFIEPAVGGKLMAVITVPELGRRWGRYGPAPSGYRAAGGRRCALKSRVRHLGHGMRARCVLGCWASRPGGEPNMGLADAEAIVCVGNGIKPDRNGSDATRQLAELLGGKLACTRPLLDRGLMSFRQMIGQVLAYR